VDHLGNALITARMSGSVDAGSGTSLMSNGGTDILVAKYGAADGKPVWSKHFGSPNDDGGNDVACTSTNRPVVVGQYVGPADFGVGLLPGMGDTDAFLAELTP